MTNYKVVNGVSYHEETPEAVVRVLEEAARSGRRIRVRLGFTEHDEKVRDGKVQAGRDWLEEFECEGTVGRSMGPTRIPILIHNSRSAGGGALLDHCIVRVIDTATKRVLYAHPNYRLPAFTLVPVDELVAATVSMKSGGPPLLFAVLADGEEQARFETREKAERWIRKMSL